MSVVWLDGEPFCAACGEHLGTEEADWGCYACGGDGFEDDEDTFDLGPPDDPVNPHPRHFLGARQDPIAPSSGPLKKVVRLRRARAAGAPEKEADRG